MNMPYNERMKKLPEPFLKRMQIMLGEEYPAFLASYEQPAARGLRINTLKIDVEELLRILPFTLAPSGVAEDSFVIEGAAEGVGRHPYHAAGHFYMQEPSVALPVGLAGIRPGMRVLDLCAAPGGKSGAAAARLAGKGFLLSNEIVPNRTRTLQSTLERMGAVNAAVTCAAPDAIAEAFPAFFDAVLVDAPCSGEGMFRKDDAAVAEWSEAHVKACALRQKLILNAAASCVREGGILVYSTCTFSYDENEAVVGAFAASHPDYATEEMVRLYPHRCAGEGHFAARLRRTGGGYMPQQEMKLKPYRDEAYAAAMRDLFAVQPEGEAFLLPDGRVTILREPLPEGMRKLRTLSSGVMAGELTKGRFEPAHALFLAAHGGVYGRTLSLPAESAHLAAFMAGEAIPCGENLRGYCAVAVDGYVLGFGKAGGGVMKNHIPKGLRSSQKSSPQH